MKSIPIKKIAIATAGIAASLFLLMGLVIALLPTVVSSEFVKKTVEEQASAALATDVTIEILNWSWSNGIVIKNIRLKDHPEFSPGNLLSLENLHLQFYLADLLKKRVHADLLVSGVQVNVIKNEDGILNLDRLSSGKPAEPDEKPPETIVEEKKEPFSTIISLPVDVTLTVSLTGIAAHYKDLQARQAFAVDNLAFSVEVPCLTEKPIHVSFLTDLSIDANRFPGQKLNFTVNYPPFKNGQMDLKQMAIDLNGHFPGITLNASGNPIQDSLKGDIALNLAEIISLAAPFLPPDLKDMALAGNILLQYTITSPPSFEMLTFDTTLIVQDMIVNGGPVPGGPLGPLSISLSHKGDFNLKDGALLLKEGRIDILSNSHLAYQATISDLNGGDPVIDFITDKFSFDFKELYNFAQPVLPEDIRKNPPAEFDALLLNIEKIGFKGRLSETPEVTLTHLNLTTPSLKVAQEPTPIDVANISLTVPGFSCTLKDMFPSSLDLSLGLAVSDVRVKGESPVNVTGINLSDLNVSVRNLNPSKTSPLGVTADVILKNLFSIDSVDVPKTASLSAFRQTSEIHCQVSENPLVRLSVDHFTTSLGGIVVDLPEPGTLKTTADIALSIPAITIPAIDPFNMDIRNAKIDVSMDEALTLSVQAEATDMAKTGMNVNGDLALDLTRLSKSLSPALLNGITLNGKTGLTWHMAGRLFTDEELKGMTESPYALKENLAFIDKATVSLALKDMDVEMALPENQSVRVREIATASPVSYTYEGKKGIGTLTGKLLVGSIETLPGNPFKKPIALSFDINARHDGLQTVLLSQGLAITPLNIKETFHLNLSFLDALLKSGLKDPVADVLTWLGASMDFSVSPMGKADYSSVNAISSLSGDVSFGTTVNLVPGDEMNVNLGLNVMNLNASEPDLFDLENLNTDLRLARGWKIRTENKTIRDILSPLSVEVLDTGSDTLSASGGSYAVSEFLDTIKTRLKSTHTISMSRFQLEGAPIPVSIKNAELDLELNEGLPNLPYVRFDLFGGTIITALSLSKKTPDYWLGFDVAFSGIDTRKVFPEKQGSRENPDTEMSGKMTLKLPIVQSMDALLSSLKLDVYFSHIGKRALERMLYALDPTESNEQIVTQRNLLRKGTPKWIRLTIDEGALSLSGKIDILGVEEDIPALKRINIANLSEIKQYERELKALSPVIDILNKLSSSVIDVTRPEDIQFLN